jgi:ubiquinone/menaquinone biosynthesis C-methylase UbiE
VYRLDRIPQEIFRLVKSKSYAFFFESMFLFRRNQLAIEEVPIKLPARTYGNSKMSARAALQSARYIFELAFENLRKPEQFLTFSSQPAWEAGLSDPQNWDRYWNESGKTAHPVYEVIAGVYRRLVIKKNLESAITREFPPGVSLLHAGCGSGQVDTALQSTWRITALDISKGALSLYSRNNKNAAAVIHGSIFNLPFPDGCFDGVYNLGVMEHFTSEEIDRILREFHRVLKPGGKIVLFWPHSKAPSVLLLKGCRYFLRIFSKNSTEFHPPEISLLSSRKQLEHHVVESGFHLVECTIGPRDFWIQAVVVCKKN